MDEEAGSVARGPVENMGCVHNGAHLLYLGKVLNSNFRMKFGVEIVNVL